MLFEVSKAIREQTKKCRHKFRCLKEGGCAECAFEAPISESLIFVTPNHDHGSCAYITSYGNGHVCSCPTRCEIYRKYVK